MFGIVLEVCGKDTSAAAWLAAVARFEVVDAKLEESELCTVPKE